MREHRLICNYIDISFIVVFFYDYILNIPAEVELIWKHVRSRGSLWYLTIRYFTFAGFVLVSHCLPRAYAMQTKHTVQICVPNFVKLSDPNCHIFNVLRQILMVINSVLISGLCDYPLQM